MYYLTISIRVRSYTNPTPHNFRHLKKFAFNCIRAISVPLRIQQKTWIGWGCRKGIIIQFHPKVDHITSIHTGTKVNHPTNIETKWWNWDNHFPSNSTKSDHKWWKIVGPPATNSLWNIISLGLWPVRAAAAAIEQHVFIQGENITICHRGKIQTI
jgi:hypothetical protein